MLCDLFSLVVGSVNHPADMIRTQSLITHGFLAVSMVSVKVDVSGEACCDGGCVLLQCCIQSENCVVKRNMP